MAQDDRRRRPADRDDMAPQAQHGARLEAWLLRTLCEPLLLHIPARVHPNTLSLLTHVTAWATVGLALGSSVAPHGLRTLCLVGAGVGMFAAMVGDCLDGMHARRTGQTSKLGEIMDHWLDAVVVPLAPLGVAFALQMPDWALALCGITGSMVYHAQLLLHHHTGQFLNPDAASGVEAQFGTALAYVGLAALFWFIPPDHPLVRAGVLVIAVVGSAVQVGIARFYYRRLRGHRAPHAYYVAVCAALLCLLWSGAIGRHGFALLLVGVSLRLSGGYVLHTLLGRPFDGVDRVLSLLLLAMLGTRLASAAAGTGPSPPGWLAAAPGWLAAAPGWLAAALPWLTGVYLLGRNALDLAAALRQIRPMETHERA